MRLRESQLNELKRIVPEFMGADCSISLFGSRTNDQAKGGDVDMFLETADYISRLQRARLKMKLELALGLPVDLDELDKA